MVNSAMGTVYDLNWHDQVTDAFNTMPAVVMMEVDGYTGPGSVKVNGVHVVPIAPTSHQWKIDEMVCTRIQSPLTLSFAITVHKCQGLTLRRVVLNFYRKDDSTGQSDVALSRVRSIDHVAFESGFSYDRFPSQLSVGAKDRIVDATNRDSQQISISIAKQSFDKAISKHINLTSLYGF